MAFAPPTSKPYLRAVMGIALSSSKIEILATSPLCRGVLSAKLSKIKSLCMDLPVFCNIIYM